MTEHYVDWAKIPERFKWVATDINGLAYAFERMPQRRVGGWYEGGAGVFASYQPGDCDWKDSLIERPADC